MGNVIGLVLYVVFVAIFFYILYGVIKAAVRDGILAADRRRSETVAAGAEIEGSGR
ncbi:hypothetical protein ACFFON_06595 [Arthrobacter citreus]|uniref:hypothetical protein n=1 Tax=Arthrobacter TaxID=1663 RepID=UPI00147945BD|nr:hypothetical protein [Arthrobacter gandavensis]